MKTKQTKQIIRVTHGETLRNDGWSGTLHFISLPEGWKFKGPYHEEDIIGPNGRKWKPVSLNGDEIAPGKGYSFHAANAHGALTGVGELEVEAL